MRWPERLFLHGGVDLSGLLEQLDVWARPFRSQPCWARAALAAAGELARQLGDFDVTAFDVRAQPTGLALSPSLGDLTHPPGRT